MRTAGPVITDTGPLIHLGEADALGLLKQFEKLFLPEIVLDELRAGDLPRGFETLDYDQKSVRLEDDPWPTLDPGETAALELCRRTDGMFLTDDLDARETAADIGAEVHGSIGVVLAAYADGEIGAERARSSIRSLKSDSTLYLSRSLVERAVDEIERRDSDGSSP